MPLSDARHLAIQTALQDSDLWEVERIQRISRCAKRIQSVESIPNEASALRLESQGPAGIEDGRCNGRFSGRILPGGAKADDFGCRETESPADARKWVHNPWRGAVVADG